MAGNTQLLSIAPSGAVSTVRRKRGTGLDLRDIGGEFSARRVSEIAWSPSSNAFEINLLVDGVDHTDNPIRLTVAMLEALGRPNATVCTFVQCQGGVHISEGVLCFEDYEDAVLVEVHYLDAAKLAGKSITTWNNEG